MDVNASQARFSGAETSADEYDRTRFGGETIAGAERLEPAPFASVRRIAVLAKARSRARMWVVNVRVLFFAGVKDAVGADRVDLTLSEGSTVAEMRERLKGRYSRAARHIDGSRMAVNQVFAEDRDILSDGDEVAVIPPVSGG